MRREGKAFCLSFLSHKTHNKRARTPHTRGVATCLQCVRDPAVASHTPNERTVDKQNHADNLSTLVGNTTIQEMKERSLDENVTHLIHHGHDLLLQLIAVDERSHDLELISHNSGDYLRHALHVQQERCLQFVPF